jgi:hypothetical protein
MASTDHFSALPVELHVAIFTLIPGKGILRARCISKNIKAVIDTNDTTIYNSIIHRERHRLVQEVDALGKVSTILLADALEWYMSSRRGWPDHYHDASLECFIDHCYKEKYPNTLDEKGYYVLNLAASSFVSRSASSSEALATGVADLQRVAARVGNQDLIKDAESLQRSLCGPERGTIVDDSKNVFASERSRPRFPASILTSDERKALQLPRLPQTSPFVYAVVNGELCTNLQTAACVRSGDIDVSLIAAALDQTFIW